MDFQDNYYALYATYSNVIDLKFHLEALDFFHSSTHHYRRSANLDNIEHYFFENYDFDLHIAFEEKIEEILDPSLELELILYFLISYYVPAHTF